MTEKVSTVTTPEVGSIWESKDKRDNGRCVKVMAISMSGKHLEAQRVVRGTKETIVGVRVIEYAMTVFVKRWRRVA